LSSSKKEAIRRRNDPRDRSTLRKSEQTRQAILDAALKLLWSHPFRELSIAELTSRTGISRPAFYQYFADLHDLMENLLNDLEEELQTAAGPWFSAEGDLVPHLAESISGLVDVCYRRGPLVRAVVEAAPMDERLERAWNAFVKVFDDAVTAGIERDQATGLVPEFDARPVAIALNRMNIGAMIHHFGRRPRSKSAPVYRSITRVWISTIYGQEALAQFEAS
jgi:AcrR family transcriptional regulator